MTISLIDGTFFRKNVSLKLKNENVAIVNAIKKGMLNYYYYYYYKKGLQELEKT